VRTGGKKQRKNDLKELLFGQKNLCEVETKEGMVYEEISTIRRKPSTLHQNGRKDTSRASQELSRLYPPKGC
jgi:hypothetical protein